MHKGKLFEKTGQKREILLRRGGSTAANDIFIEMKTEKNWNANFCRKCEAKSLSHGQSFHVTKNAVCCILGSKFYRRFEHQRFKMPVKMSDFIVSSKPYISSA